MSDDSTEKTALVPLEERSVDFYGDQVLAVLVEENSEEVVYVPIRPIAQYLGVGWGSQYNRLRRDPVLSESMRSIFITKTNPHAAGDPHMVCLPLKFLPGWLFGISANRVREELRDKVIRYQRECYDVLWRAFQADALTRQPPQTSGSLAQIRSLALAIAQMAEQQMVLEGRVEETHELAASAHARMDRAAEVVAEMRRRLITVESRVLPAAAISDEQAAEISGQVKALAELLTSQDSSTAQAGQRQNHYQSIFAEIYRRFGVSSYKLIRQDQYQAVLSFLDDWRIAAS